MEFQISTSGARQELSALEAAMDAVARKAEQSGRQFDEGMARVSAGVRNVQPVAPEVPASLERTKRVIQGFGDTPQLSILNSRLGALRALRLDGLTASISNFATSLSTIVIPQAFAGLGTMITSAAATFGTAGAAIGRSIGTMVTGLGRLAAAAGPVGVAFAALATVLTGGIFVGFSGGIQRATANFERFRATITAVTGSQEQAKEQWTFVKNVANETATSLEVVSRSYMRFSIAAQQSGLSLGTTQDMFRKMAATFRVFQLDAQGSRLSFLAFEQMINKGKVSMEELRRQLGEHLPGAMGAMAKAVGVTVPQLDGMIRKGQLGIDAVKKMVDQLYTDFGSKLPEAMKTAQAQFQIMSNTMESLAIAFGSGFNAYILPSLQRFNGLLSGAAMHGFLEGLGSLVGAIGGTVIQAFNVLISVVGVFSSIFGPIIGFINSVAVGALYLLSAALGYVSAGIDLLAAGFNYLWSFFGPAVSAISEFAQVLFSDLVAGLRAAWEWFTNNEYVINGVKNSVIFLTGVWGFLKDLLFTFIGIPLLVYWEGIKGVMEGVVYIARSMINWFMQFPGVAAVVEYFGTVIGRVRDRLTEKAAAARVAAGGADTLGNSMDGAAEKGKKLSGEIRGVTAAALDAVASWSSLDDFGFGHPGQLLAPGDKGPKATKKKENEFLKGFSAADTKKLLEKAYKDSLKPTTTPGDKTAGGKKNSVVNMTPAEFFGQFNQTIQGANALMQGFQHGRVEDIGGSGQGGLSQGLTAHKVALEASTRAVSEGTAVSREHGRILQASNDNISTLASSVDGVATSFQDIQTSFDSVDASLQGVVEPLNALPPSLDAVTSGLGDNSGALEANTNNAELLASGLEETRAEIDLLNQESIPEQISSLGDNTSSQWNNTDELIYNSQQMQELSAATASLEGSMNDVSSAISDGGGGGGGGDSSGPTTVQDLGGMATTAEFKYGGLTNRPKHFTKAPAAAFAGAPHFAEGGIPAILHPNEAVVPLAGGAIPVQMSGGGGGALSVGLLAAIAETVRFMHQGQKDSDLLATNNATLAHNDAAKTHLYLQALQDMMAEQTSVIESMFERLISRVSSGGGGSGGVSGGALGEAPLFTNPFQEDLGPAFDPKMGGSAKFGLPGAGAGHRASPRVAPAKWNTEKMRWEYTGPNGQPERVPNPYQIGMPGSVPGGIPFGFAEGSPNAFRELNGGFTATLHPDEAVVPLPDGRSIPVSFDESGLVDRILDGIERGGGRGGVTVNISMTVQTPDAASFKASQDQVARDLEMRMRRAVRTLGPGMDVDDPTRRHG